MAQYFHEFQKFYSKNWRSQGGLYSMFTEKWAGLHRDHKILMTKIYFNGSLERFTKFSNHKTLELYGNGKKQS